MIHKITILHAGHTFITRFRADQIPDVRWRLAQQADAEWFTFDKAFQANQQLLQIEDQQMEMDQLEGFRKQLVRLGFFPTLTANEDGWQCLLMTAVTHRPPFGRGATAIEAMIAADLERVELMKKVKQKA